MRAIRDARARETPPPAEPAAVAAQVVTAASAPTSAPERGKSWLWLAGIAAVLLVVAGAAAVALLVPANDPGEPASSVEARESIRTIQANVLASRKLGVKKPTVLASERDSNRARSNCTLDPRWPGDYALTTQVDGKGTRGRYHLRIEASSCRLAIRVTRDGFTVGTGPLLSKPDYRGHAEGVLSPWPTDPARFATHLRFTNSVGTPPLYIRMDFRLRDDGELEGVWAYEKSSFKVGFHGPARAVRVNSIRYGAHPDLDGWGRLSSDTRTLEHCMVLKDSDEEATWHCAGAR